MYTSRVGMNATGNDFGPAINDQRRDLGEKVCTIPMVELVVFLVETFECLLLLQRVVSSCQYISISVSSCFYIVFNEGNVVG